MINFEKLNKVFSRKRILIPIVLGVGVATWLAVKEFDIEKIKNISFGTQFYFFIFLAILFVALRDFAYIIRLRILTNKSISWKNSFQVIMLWEFASSLTPSVVGGSAVAMFIINKEKISFGRSTAIVMITAIMDELFYVVMVPMIFVFAGLNALFVNGEFELFNISFNTIEIFFIGYFFIVFLIFILIYAIFISPKRFKKILFSISKLRFFKRWQQKFIHIGNDIITTSTELKGKPFSFWAQSFGATLLSWTARFLVVNCLIAAVVSLSFNQHLLVYGRQLIMWVILLISPTPGGSGIAEFFFPIFLDDFIPIGLVAAIALFWRTLTYYPYLFIGTIVFPIWIKRVIRKDKQEEL